MISENNALFDSLIEKLDVFPMLRKVLYLLLFQGKELPFNPDEEAINVARMFGFIKVRNHQVVVANRIFETRIYNYFLSMPKMQSNRIYTTALQNKNQFCSKRRA